jgi:hypothetical protein
MAMRGGISLRISEVPVKMVLEHFLLEGKLKTVGSLDDGLNNEAYSYVSMVQVVATPWHQTNPLKPMSCAEMHFKIEDIWLIYPVEPAGQAAVKLLPHSERVILYLGGFVLNGKLSMGADIPLSGVMEALPKRFLPITEVSLFPLFPPKALLPGVMPVALVNRQKISHYYASES